MSTNNNGGTPQDTPTPSVIGGVEFLVAGDSLPLSPILSDWLQVAGGRKHALYLERSGNEAWTAYTPDRLVGMHGLNLFTVSDTDFRRRAHLHRIANLPRLMALARAVAALPSVAVSGTLTSNQLDSLSRLAEGILKDIDTCAVHIDTSMSMSDFVRYAEGRLKKLEVEPGDNNSERRFLQSVLDDCSGKYNSLGEVPTR